MAEGRFRVAVVGATGMVGQEMLRVLHQRRFPISELMALASDRSVGEAVRFGNDSITVAAATARALGQVDLALFSAGSDVSLELAPGAAQSGALVVDNSAAWRLQPGIALVVPEINPQALELGGRIVANPNCSTIQLVMTLEPLRRLAGLRRVLMNTYQSASGHGKALVDELAEQTRQLAAGGDPKPIVYPHRLAYNVVPGGWPSAELGFNEEEWKVMRETTKILESPDLAICCTTVRVPVPVAHAQSVWVETDVPLSADRARQAWATMPGVRVVDDPAAQVYPTPSQAVGTDDVLVGRIRVDPSCSNGLAYFSCADNLRKGAALNAVQVAELAISRGLL